MPFFDEPQPPQNLANIAPIDQPEALEPTMGETFGAAFRTQNVIGSYLSSRGMPNPYEVEDGFDPIDYVKDDPKYSPYVDEFAGIFNRKAADAKKMQIDREEQDRRTLDAAGPMGVVAEMAAGVVDLPTLLPVGGAIVGPGRSLAGTALRVGIGAGIDAGISEAGLQATQATRTGAESALNIGGSIILGGALGALAGRYLSGASQMALSRKIESQTKEFDDFDKEFIAVGKPQSAGAAARDAGPLVLKDERLFKAMKGVNQQDPMIRLQLSDLDEARGIVRGLAETPLEYVDNAKGVATEAGGSVETRMKMWNAPLANTLSNIDTHFARYFHATPEPSSWQVRLSPARSEFSRLTGRSQKMTFAEFKEEVGKAAFSAEQHQIPEVAAAAREYRQIDDAMKKAAIDAGLFPEDVKVKGDVSHLFRMYNREAIIARRNDFSAILQEHFLKAQEAARVRGEEIRIGNKIVDIEKLRETVDKVDERVQGFEERLSQRQAIRGRKVQSLEGLRQTRLDVLKERAPAGLVKMLRGSDENAVMIDAVKQSRAAARSANKKQPFVDRSPVLALIKNKGGVRIGSKLDSELRAMDVTPKTHPGLFRKQGGIGDVDNFVKAEDEIFADLPDDGNGYVNPVAVMESIRSELGGNPLRTPDEIMAAEALDQIDRAASEWLDKVGLPDNATVKEVRDFIDRVLAAEKNVDGMDSRISRFEREVEEFDAATDKLVDERDITSAEAREVSARLDDLEKELEEVRDLANASPRVSLIVDYATVRRDLFKAKLKERGLSKRVDALKRMEAEGRANNEMLAELSAKEIDLGRLRSDIEGMKVKANKLEPMAPKVKDAEQAEQFADLMPAEIQSLVDETINTILGNAEGRIPYDIVSGPRGPLRERMLSIESERIQDFLELDIEKVLQAQVRTMSADVELARKFGSVDLSEQIRKINDEADSKIRGASDAKERQRLEGARKAAIRDVKGIRDRLRGQYKLPDNPDSIVLRAGRVIRSINYLRLLGGMTISAIPDMAKPVFQYGLTRTFRDGFMPLVTNFRAFRLAGEEVKAAGTALDMVLDSRTMALADITQEFGRHSKFERGLQAAQSKFGVVSLMAPWNAAAKQFAGMITMTNMLQAAERVAKGTATTKEIAGLASGGIDADMAARIAKEFAEHGDTQGGVLLAKAGDWADTRAREAFRAAVVRDVDRVIVTPGQDKPLWMSTELGKMVGQFKSFGVSSVQKTMFAGIQQRDAATLNGVLMMLGLGALTYKVKSDLAGRDTSDKPSVWAVEAFDRSGLVGWLMEVNNAAEKITRGKVGFSALTGTQISRYASRNATASLLGPSLGTVQDILDVTGSAMTGEFSDSDKRKAMQLVPAQNLFWLRMVLEMVDKSQ